MYVFPLVLCISAGFVGQFVIFAALLQDIRSQGYEETLLSRVHNALQQKEDPDLMLSNSSIMTQVTTATGLFQTYSCIITQVTITINASFWVLIPAF